MIRAAFLAAPRQLRVRPITLTDLASDELLVAVEACGVCATDLAAWSRGRPDTAGLTGHEVAGRVVAVGGGAAEARPGDRVCIEPNLAAGCGRCERCVAGLAFSCSARRRIQAWGFADAMVVPAASAVPIPPQLPADVATLAEPLACAVHALRGSALGRGELPRLEGRDVLIVGAGALGILSLALARHCGARRVVVAARHDHQRAAVAAFGGEVTGEELDGLDGLDPPLVLIAAGGEDQLLDAALSAVCVGGEVVVLGLLDRAQTIDARRAVLRGLRVSFSVSYGGGRADGDLARGLEILGSDPVAFSRLLGERFELAEVAAAFELAADPAAHAFRVLVAPEAAALSG